MVASTGILEICALFAAQFKRRRGRLNPSNITFRMLTSGPSKRVWSPRFVHAHMPGTDEIPRFERAYKLHHASICEFLRVCGSQNTCGEAI
jgi:hypothetical protein